MIPEQQHIYIAYNPLYSLCITDGYFAVLFVCLFVFWLLFFSLSFFDPYHFLTNIPSKTEHIPFIL